MAFQGKGILGNFKGKVGNIVGVVQRGKGVIRQVQSYSIRVLTFLLNWRLVRGVNLVRTSIFNYSVKRSVVGGAWSTGCQISNLTSENIVGVGCQMANKFSNVFLCLGDYMGAYNYSFYEYSLYFWAGKYNVYNLGVSKTSPVTYDEGDKFRIEIKKGIVDYKIKKQGQQWVVFYSQPFLLSAPVRGVISMGGGNSTVDRLEFADDYYKYEKK
jgi:hypothetical protein